MEFLSAIDPLTGLILLSASIICFLVLFSKGIKWVLKGIVIIVMLAYIIYFLQQAGVLG